MRKFLAAIWDTIEVAIVALVIVLIIRTFLFQPFFVEGASMYPNFKNGDYLIVDELTYRLREPQRGEIIVFHPPQAAKEYYIKRIIALPGEKIEIKDGQIKIYNQNHPEGFVLKENYLLDSKTPGEISLTLESNEYFVLGDNRYASYDSRAWGTVTKDKIIGIVRLRVWPFNNVKAFSTVQYQN
ncbi:MAG: signal peptidase I [Patescibacteria group bacterium]|jgi:signal peptidase I|nr:signal peptidase I [Patescibacteria group bacterium]